MTNPEDPSFLAKEHLEGTTRFWSLGLSKREWYAGLAMQGNCSAIEFLKDIRDKTGAERTVVEKIAIVSCEMADALIQELNKPKETEKP